MAMIAPATTDPAINRVADERLFRDRPLFRVGEPSGS